MTKSLSNTKRLTLIAMFCAISYVMVFLSHLVPFFAFIPSAPFLAYDPKDIIIAIGGFMLGPVEALVISAVVSAIEMVTISTTGPIGFVMNVVATVAFACTASVVYKRKHNMAGAVIGLGLGVIAMTAVMILWNYLITPMYMGVSREVIVAMIIPAFLPFNLIKAGANMALTMFLYKPVVTALRKASLLPPSSAATKARMSPGFMILAFIILATCLLFILMFMKIL